MKTIVSESYKKAVMRLPEYLEFERIMKAAYGDDWELVTPEEIAAGKYPDISEKVKIPFAPYELPKFL